MVYIYIIMPGCLVMTGVYTKCQNQTLKIMQNIVCLPLAHYNLNLNLFSSYIICTISWKFQRFSEGPGHVFNLLQHTVLYQYLMACNLFLINL
jgi:hypothetical protein